MPKYKVGKTESIMYDGEMYELTGLEFSDFEERLKELDQYGMASTEARTEWIIYEFLRSLDYLVDPPRVPNPQPAIDLFDMEASEGAAEEVFSKLYDESKNRQHTLNQDHFSEYLTGLPQRGRSSRRSINAKSVEQREQEEEQRRRDAQHGGVYFFSIVIIIMLLFMYSCS